MAWFDDNVLRPEVSGFFGAIVGLFNSPGSSWRERAFNFTAGVSAAWFVAPWIEELFDIKAKNGQMAVAFVVGLIGMNLVGKTVEYARATNLRDLPLVRNVLPPSNDKEPKQ